MSIPENPPNNSERDSASHPRLVLWFVRGTDSDGKKWESGHRHSRREGAEDEIERWQSIGKTGEMKIMREVFPQNDQVELPPNGSSESSSSTVGG